MTEDDLLPPGEPFPGLTIRADGWKYRDWPWSDREVFNRVMELIGEENVKWLAFTSQGDRVRGQCFLSPVALERLIAEKKRRTGE